VVSSVIQTCADRGEYFVHTTRRHFVVSLASTAVLAAAPRFARAADELRIAFVPEVATTPTSIAAKQPFIDYFTKATGRSVKLVIPTNYAATVEALGNGSVDLAHFGGLTYVKAAARYGARPIAQRIEDQHFHSLFITNAADIRALRDLKGKTFAFGDVNSTSGHLMPVKELLDAGIDPDHDLVSRFTGNHTTTALAVNAGQVAAGALDETVYHKLVDDKTIDPQKARVFFTSQAFVDYTWAVRSDIDSGLAASIQHGFLTLKDPAVLELLRATRYVTVDDREYDTLRTVAKSVGLL
jgi:phosphonate transport system substrate-binding protein